MDVCQIFCPACLTYQKSDLIKFRFQSRIIRQWELQHKISVLTLLVACNNGAGFLLGRFP